MPTTYQVPPEEELVKRYGHLINDVRLNNVADWTLPNHAEDFAEGESLKNLSRIGSAITQAMDELFEQN